MSNFDNIKLNDNEVIVRISAHGQYKINKKILERINQIDNEIVNVLENTQTNEANNNNSRSKEEELSKKIQEIINLILSQGTRINDKEILQSNLFIPSSDISIEEAKKIFRNEGIIPDI